MTPSRHAYEAMEHAYDDPSMRCVFPMMGEANDALGERAAIEVETATVHLGLGISLDVFGATNRTEWMIGKEARR
jgi:hypothetical protein